VAFPFMPITAKTIKKVSGAIKDIKLSDNRTKINGKFEFEKIKQVLETNPHPLKKILSHRRTHNHY
jgi:hypothetical protein